MKQLRPQNIEKWLKEDLTLTNDPKHPVNARVGSSVGKMWQDTAQGLGMINWEELCKTGTSFFMMPHPFAQS